MAFDSTIADRVRAALAKLELESTDNIFERRMFGGLCLLLNGSMLAGVTEARVMIRLDDEAMASALKRPEVSPMDFTGKPLRNFAYLDPTQITDRQLVAWLTKSLHFARSRPAKGTTKPRHTNPPSPL